MWGFNRRTAASFLARSWPYIVFGILVVVHAYFYFWHAGHPVIGYLQFLLSAIVGLAVVVYVIYTRQLAVSSQETADANRQLLETMRCLLVEEWVAQERPSAEARLVRGGESLSHALHVDDMGMTAEMYQRHLDGQTVRVLIFRPINSGPRLVLLKRVKFEIAHVRGRTREISYDPERPIRIAPNESIELQVLCDFVGQLDARVMEIEYLDGDRTQTRWVASPWRERLYSAPETAGGAQ